MLFDIGPGEVAATFIVLAIIFIICWGVTALVRRGRRS